MDEYALEVSNLCKNFDTVKVLKNVTFKLKKGEVLGLVGENGAGKSTIMNLLGGVYPITSGEIKLFGARYTPRNPKEAMKSGIAFIHQELNLFTNLSIAENLFIDGFLIKYLISQTAANTRAKALLERFDLNVNPSTLVENLTMGMRQMVEIAKAVSKDARVIFFDEPTTSLSNTEKETLFRIIRELAGNGISMIYISHALEDVISLCDSIVVLRDGETIGEQLDSKNVTKEELIKKMVGREMGTLYPYIDKNIGGEALGVRGLNSGKILRDISIRINKGEIAGLYGLMGAGRSELARAIYGVDKYDSGEIMFEGKPIVKSSPMKWVASGFAFITENRRDEGLLLPKSVQENVSLVNLPNFKGRIGRLNKKLENKTVDGIITELKIKTFDKKRQIARLLSGGNQQKVVIGKWLLANPKVFIVDEPTKGVDVGAKYEIYTQINNLAAAGSAILVISSEMEELMGICDRIYVMSKGKITAEFSREDFSQEKLLESSINEVS